MLDIKLIREKPELVRADLKRRRDNEKLKWLEDLIKIDKEWRPIKQEVEKLRHRRNELTLEITKSKKEGKNISSLIKEAKKIPDNIKNLEEKEKILKQKIDFYLMRLPNLMHKSVPYGKDESDNQVVRKWGKIIKPKFELKSHIEVVENLKLANFDKAAKVAGQSFNYIFNELALLDLALQRFAIDFLIKRGFTLVIPPHMLNRSAYEGVVSLDDFENVMYKIENEDAYLIATAEHPIGALLKDEILEEKNLPLKFCGISTNFRKEIGSRGVDTKGFFRMHQFNKVEQFIFSKPEDSWKHHEEIEKNSEELYKQLKIPFRVVNVCTGDLGIIAAKKYDLEAWFPRQNKYGEVGSNSNCTDYQARRLKTRYKNKKGEINYVHTLNNTAIATSRAMVAILENYQQKDGSVKVPQVLQKYMNKIKVIKKK